MIKVLGCIQARMGSRRLPGKVLKKISGKSLIVHIIERLRACKTIDRIVLATSKKEEDDLLEKVACKNGIECVRGSEQNVLKRFYDVVCLYWPHHIVRICADSPLIDPLEIDRIVRHHIRRDADYSFNHIPEMNNSYPDGVGAEIFKSNVIANIIRQKTTKAEQEHINEYIWNHLDRFRIETIAAPKSIAYPEYRFEVNTEDDLKFIRKIYNHLYEGKAFNTRSVIEYLKSQSVQ
ncbi:MAG: glycosyltransferase family protein [Candidatus Omnitrophica bacterium]|nr:glycosyltransferase family protein [Candidatus Omnitrophota bacterium]